MVSSFSETVSPRLLSSDLCCKLASGPETGLLARAVGISVPLKKAAEIEQSYVRLTAIQLAGIFGGHFVAV